VSGAGDAPEPQPLVLDVAAIETGVRAFVANRAGVAAYVAAIAAVPLGPQPIVIDGQRAGEFDPFSKLAPQRAGLAAAQAHGESMAGALSNLHGWASSPGLDPYVRLVTDPLAKVQEVLTAIPSGGAPSSEQARQMMEQLYQAELYARGILGPAVTTTRNTVFNFLSHLVDDHDTLANGPLAVAGAMEAIDRNVSEQAMKYLLNPLTSGLGNILLEMGRGMHAHLERLIAAMRTALAGHEGMRTGISALATAVETAVVKLQGGVAAAQRASGAQLPVVVRKLEVGKAIVSWQQFLDFLHRSGL
jgi:hypothetical protein